MTTLISQPFQIFTDFDGSPLNSGRVFIGVAGSNPETNLQQVFWDAGLTVPAAQPIETIGGYMVRSGTPAVLYTTGDYSITVRNKKGAVVYSAPRASLRADSSSISYGGTTVEDTLNMLPAYLDSYSGNDDEKWQAAISDCASGAKSGIKLPARDIYISSQTDIATSISIEGSVDSSGEILSRLLVPSSGLNFSRSSGADNIVNVFIKNFRVDKLGTAKAVGSFGIKITAGNFNIVPENVECRYFEKNWWFVGCIGAEPKNISGRAGKYGLFTESASVVPFAYDTTNINMYGCKFADQNDVGVHLGPLAQGINFFGGDIERNMIGVEFNATAPASGAINFYGTWFEANGTHWVFNQKPIPVAFNGCYIYGGASGGTTLWSNGGSGSITATLRECKLSAGMAVDMDVFNGVWESNKDDGTLTYTATEPNGYYFQKLANTSFTIGGKTLYNVENIGGGRYNVWAAGAPASAGFVIGSRWTDVTSGLEYLHDGTQFRKQPTVIEASVVHDFVSVPAQSTANTLLTVTGVAAGDAVALGVSGTPPNGLIFVAVATAANAVRIYAHNFTAAAIDPASFTFSVKVFK